jgi:hypothetical protein
MTRMSHVVDADYLVVGAGAAGMAFTDALIDHADVKVALVDRRHGPGGHWLDAYSFVRLHQASPFYGVASTLLGEGVVQSSGPEAGLYERATAPEICAYYAAVLRERMVGSGKVTFYPSCDYLGDRTFVSRLSGKRYEVDARCRVVDASYLAPRIPADTPPPFGVADGAHVVTVNDLIRVGAAPPRYVIAGSGKTATDACVWLLANGVDPDAICWVRPRDPWMLNRALVQPDPAVFVGMAASIFEAAAEAVSVGDLFLQLEAAEVLLRIDPSVTPTMAKTPTIASWEIDLLRTIGDVVRLGHIRGVEPGRMVMTDGEVRLPQDTLVVHCAASGLRYPPLVPIWGRDAIVLQPVRTGFPCFGAALIGYVEATRDDDAEKNRICPSSPYSNTTRGWLRTQVLGARASLAFSGEPDIKQWADLVQLNPGRVAPGTAPSADLIAARERFRKYIEPGLMRMTELAGPLQDGEP